MRIKAPFLIGRTIFGRTLVFSYGLIDDRLSCVGHANSWGREWWFRWGYSIR